MSEHDFQVVLGASGGVGNAVVRELVAQGKRVRGVTRSGKADVPAGVEIVAADISHLDQARAVCQDASVVYFCANPAYNRWPQEFPPLLEGAIAGASAAGAKLIAAANLYVYAPPAQPLTEEMPWKPITRKGKVRAAMDERLLAAHRSGEVQAAIGRASDFFGPAALNSSVLGERFFDALLAGKAVQWIGRLDVPHTHSYIDDFGRGLVTLGARPEALGQSWHITAAEPLTGQEFLKRQASREKSRASRLQCCAWRASSIRWPAKCWKWLKSLSGLSLWTARSSRASLAARPRRIKRPCARRWPGSRPGREKPQGLAANWERGTELRYTAHT